MIRNPMATVNSFVPVLVRSTLAKMLLIVPHSPSLEPLASVTICPFRTLLYAVARNLGVGTDGRVRGPAV
jgi:hypothetical protein